MFLLALRDPYGLGVALRVIVAWQLCFLAGAVTAMPPMFIVFYTLALLMTARASFQLWKSREQLRFATEFGKRTAFPLDRRRARMVLNFHVAGTALFFVAPILAFTMPQATVDLAEKQGLLYVSFLFGQFGMVGIVHHVVLSSLGCYESSADRQ